MSKMIVTVCQRGNVRSVTAAQILKDMAMRSDVFAMGIETTTDETRMWLFERANTILVVGHEAVYEQIPAKYKDKTVHLNVGEDKWGQAMHPTLVASVLFEMNNHTDLLQQGTRWNIFEYQQMITAHWESMYTANPDIWSE